MSTASESAMADATVDIELDWHVRQEYVPGVGLSGFFDGLRRGLLLGSRCEPCAVISCPPRDFCNRCLGACAPDVELALEGEVRSLTVINSAFTGFPEPPYAIAFVQLDGADTALLNYLDGRDWAAGEDWSSLVGSRCKVVMAEQRGGGWADFRFQLTLGKGSRVY
jgi:uncharacterized OB-fold protein